MIWWYDNLMARGALEATSRGVSSDRLQLHQCSFAFGQCSLFRTPSRLTALSRTPVLPEATVVGAVSAQLRRPRPQSATSAIRRLRPAVAVPQRVTPSIIDLSWAFRHGRNGAISYDFATAWWTVETERRRKSASSSTPAPGFADEVSRTLSNHDCRHVRVAAHDARHH